jgi:hypothetical protein
MGSMKLSERRLIDLVLAQIPRRFHGRVDIKVKSDPYYLRTEVIVTPYTGEEYSSGPLDVVCDGTQVRACKLPDWFISHVITLPLGPETFRSRLWSSLYNLEHDGA